jgi:outer membrane protein, multidrug efflux system
MTMRCATLILCAALYGCALSTEKSDTSAVVPETWKHATPAEDPITRTWWQDFGSKELDRIIEIAQRESLDIAAAKARVRQAHALARIAGAPLFPQVDAAAEARRHDALNDDALDEGKSFSAALAIGYEVDLWGGNRAASDSAALRAQASEFERDALTLSVTAAAANLWLQGGGLRDRIAISESNLQNGLRVLEMVQSRHRAGAASALELAQQRSLIAAQRRLLAALKQRADETDAALAVLLGRPAERLTPANSLGGLRIPRTAAGVPSELLARRPDIARAEAQLAATDADVVVARAAMLPRLRLGASLFAIDNRSYNLFNNPAYSLAAALTAPIFDGGRLEGQRELARAFQEETLAQYRMTIVSAFGEVEIALRAVAGLEEQSRAQEEGVLHARRAFELAESRYRAGADTLLTFLIAQRTLYEAQEIEAELRMLRLQAGVVLFKALGGGWSTS